MSALTAAMTPERKDTVKFTRVSPGFYTLATDSGSWNVVKEPDAWYVYFFSSNPDGRVITTSFDSYKKARLFVTRRVTNE